MAKYIELGKNLSLTTLDFVPNWLSIEEISLLEKFRKTAFIKS